LYFTETKASTDDSIIHVSPSTYKILMHAKVCCQDCLMTLIQ